MLRTFVTSWQRLWTSLSSKEVELKKCINELEAEKLRLRDIESKERLTQQQVTSLLVSQGGTPRP